MALTPSDKTPITKAHNKTVLTPVEARADLTIEGELNLSDYIQDVEPSERTRQAVYAWSVQHREITKEKLLTDLMKLFGWTSVASFLLVGVAITNPNVDKSFIKDVIPLFIGPQVTLLGGAYATYVLHSRKQEK